jgi:superfamily II DNA or RNA helicase
MTSEIPIPVSGCWVRRTRSSERLLGQVLGHRMVAGHLEIRVRWRKDSEEWVALAELRSGLQLEWAVQDMPVSTTRRALGPGRVVGHRELGGREQALVQLDQDGRSLWLPYENLRRIKDARLRYARAETYVADHAERFRLRLLAHALENWNYLTGSLDRLDVDPLPHQIQLVHRILSSGNYNWLIADDVGLGKTIEVGLLLAALKRKDRARRVLVVAPAGLTRQWQDELKFKFGEDYLVYGHDFTIRMADHWKLYDHVIVSLDLAKRDEHMQTIRQAGGWDVVIFDESHKLSRYASGERAQRYRLAEMLRPLSDAFLLLSGTPHQGYVDRFQALLELVRPDLTSQIQTLEANPEIVREMILRNRKSDVTDADGKPIFRGHQVHRVPVEPSAETREFQRLLNDYLQRGYRAGAAGGNAGRAIGFVMTTYRKLASSSIAAIQNALEGRLSRLEGESAVILAPSQEMTLEDLAEGGDEQDNLSQDVSATGAEEFFAFEHDLLTSLLAKAAVVRAQDEKLRIFLEQAADRLMAEGKKLLVFTEYRATQSYLKEALERRFPHAGEVLQINGSMKLEDKLIAIAAFNEGPNCFMISTEAGGEGLNLHRACHVMINYDLPWNPARLVQRIGRLYRYGQKEAVVVVNLHARDSFDNAAIDLMLQRVAQIAQDMAPVGTEYNDRLHADILGNLLENLDLATILQAATAMEMPRTREQIEDALSEARRAKVLQDEIFAHVEGFDPNALGGTLGFTMKHVSEFIRGMLPLIGARVDHETHGGEILEIRLPEERRGEFGEFGQRTVVRITTDRRLAQRLPDVVLLDFEAEFFQYLIEHAQSHDFDGLYTSIDTGSGARGMLTAFKLRWQNDQGEPLTEEFLPVFLGSDGKAEINPPFFAALLADGASAVPVPNAPPPGRDEAFQRLVDRANRRLAEESTRFKHPNGMVYLAAADCRPA